MADVIVLQARQVRSWAQKRLHEVTDDFLDPANGRTYATRCGLKLSVGAHRAVLSTRCVTCVRCDPSLGVEPDPGPSCIRCDEKPGNVAWCCSTHGKLLCHRCYRRTHFVEMCVAGCPDCATQGLDPAKAVPRG